MSLVIYLFHYFVRCVFLYLVRSFFLDVFLYVCISLLSARSFMMSLFYVAVSLVRYFVMSLFRSIVSCLFPCSSVISFVRSVVLHLFR